MEDTLARALGAGGLIVALLSLGWQAYTWRRSTGKVKVDLRRYTIDAWNGQRDAADVTVRNVGSGPVFIESISFSLQAATPVVWKLDDGVTRSLADPLGAGEAAVWRYTLSHTGKSDDFLTVPLRAIVRLGDGRQAWSSTDAPVFRVGPLAE